MQHHKFFLAAGVIAFFCAVFEFLVPGRVMLVLGIGAVLMAFSGLNFYLQFMRPADVPPRVPPMARREERLLLWGGIGLIVFAVVWLPVSLGILVLMFPQPGSLPVWGMFLIVMPTMIAAAAGGSALLMIFWTRQWS